LFGSKAESEGVADEVWLRLVGERSWVVIGRDTRILERPSELDAYLRAKVHMFLFPGNATRNQLIDITTTTLIQICTRATEAMPAVWRVRGGSHPHLEQLTRLTRKRNR
jgi:hypothetical protein